jgi:N4-gp56 family major capsid protein
MFEFVFKIQLFADAGSVVNTTADSGMSSAMKTFYDTALLENARAEAVYGQIGKQQALPAHHGKTVEWRKWNTLPAPDKLEEGVIPNG